MTSPASVPIPRSSNSNPKKPPVWPIWDPPSDLPAPDSVPAAPLSAKCDRDLRDGGVCCKDLRGNDERTLIDPDTVRDVVIGLSDGLTVPFALTAGLSSLGESRLVVLGGIAELIAGAISMGVGGFLASQAERDQYRYLENATRARIMRSCMGEREREVHAVLGSVGVDEATSRAVAKRLCEVELLTDGDSARHPGLNSHVDPDEEMGRTRLRWSKDFGLVPFLMKFGEGLEEMPARRPYVSAATIGMGYLLGGLIPLLPYFFIPQAHIALAYSCLVTGVVLLVFGVIKARVTGQGYIWGAVSTLFVGGAAAAAAYGIVRALERGDEL